MRAPILARGRRWPPATAAAPDPGQEALEVAAVAAMRARKRCQDRPSAHGWALMIAAGIHGIPALMAGIGASSPGRTAGTSPGPLRVANPTLDPVVDRQARFRVSGTGPVSQRTIEPVTSVAVQLAERDGSAVDAVRRVLRLVEDTAGGARASEAVQVNGVAFSDSSEGLGANTYRAHMDDDTTFRAGVAGMSRRAMERQAKILGERSVQQHGDQLANVVAGWMNLGTTATDALLDRGSSNAQQLADAVRILLHESVHLAETTKTGLSPTADAAMQEALAEARSTQTSQLQRARSALGLDDRIGDAALLGALRIRPYAQHEFFLDAVLTAAEVQPRSAEALAVVSQPARVVLDELAARIVRPTGESPEVARRTIEDGFTAIAS
jgi:hypothetical protein